MIQYVRNGGVVYFRFTVDYMGAMANKAIYALLENSTLAQIEESSMLAVDFSDVESMNMQDSDRAAFELFEKRLRSLIESKGTSLEAILNDVSGVRILPADPEVKKIFLERNRRMKFLDSIADLWPIAENKEEGLKRVCLDMDTFDSIEWQQLIIRGSVKFASRMGVP